MKRLLIAILLSSILISCTNDDDVILVSVCETPLDIKIENITDTSALISWTNNNTSSWTGNTLNSEIVVEFGPSGFQPGSGVSIPTMSSSLMLQNLSPTTSYDFYVTAVCSINNVSITSNTNSFSTDYPSVVSEFLPTLSELNLFEGDIADLNLSPKVFKYDLHTELFTDYAHKLRTIALPQGEALRYQDDGFPIFPTGTVISKTFYYNLDETDPSSDRHIIETRVLIKRASEWEIGNYVWNEEMTEAFLDGDQHDVKVDYKDENGALQSVDYVVPGSFDCTKCHSNSGNVTPIGPKLRTMNFEVNGGNQLQKFIDTGHLINAPQPDAIATIPDWEDDVNYTLEERARAYLDVNCAHCHEPGGFCVDQSTLDLRFETSLEDSNIYIRRFSIGTRMSFYSPGSSMPFIGTTMVHTEGYQLVQEYLDSLD